MPSLQRFVEVLQTKCAPFQFAIYYAWSRWGRALEYSVNQISNADSVAWVKLNKDRRGRRQNYIQHRHTRTWQDAYTEMLDLINTFYVINEETLGNYYEFFCRSVMSISNFVLTFPKYYSHKDVDVRGSDEVLNILRDAVSRVWMYPEHQLFDRPIREELEKHSTLISILTYFLENVNTKKATNPAKGS